MKKLFPLLVIFLFTSCANYLSVVEFLDYSKYNEQGFFVTESNSVNFEYSPIGSVHVLLGSGVVNTNASKEKIEDSRLNDIYYSRSNGSMKKKDATLEEALQLVIEKSKSQGANGIINLSYEYIHAYKNEPDGWYVSAMAVIM